jgi:hypothetical protein
MRSPHQGCSGGCFTYFGFYHANKKSTTTFSLAFHIGEEYNYRRLENKYSTQSMTLLITITVTVYCLYNLFTQVQLITKSQEI